LFGSKVIVEGAGSMLQGPAMALAKIAAEVLPKPLALVPIFVRRWRAVVQVGENLWREATKACAPLPTD